MEDAANFNRFPQSFAGLHVDDFNKIRLFEPDAEQLTSELHDGCKDFAEKTIEFQQLGGDLLHLSDRLAINVELQKTKAIGCRNALHNLVKENATKRQQLKALIHEKKTQLERLYLQYTSLMKVETEQNDFVDQFLLHN